MKILICGDIALCRNVGRKILAGEGAEIVKGLEQTFQEADLFLANVEVPLTDSETPRWNHFTTLKGPREGGGFLHKIGVDIASLANNHIADYGERGLGDTIAVLEEHNIAWAGAGWSPDQARRPIIIERAGLKVAVLALAQQEISAAVGGQWGAGVLTDEYAVATVRELAREADIVIAYLHFGVEFFEYPTPHQVQLSRALIDAGAHMVIGHHPHVPQGVEFYKNGFIAYSLGNFIFDMPAGQNKFNRLGLLVEAETDNDGTLQNVKVVPVSTANGRTRQLTGSEKKEAETYISALSSVLRDKKELYRRYYFVCRDNLQIHQRALVGLVIRKRNFKRLGNWLSSQRWPQIAELRRDLLRFLLSGEALRLEKEKGPPEEGLMAYVWRGICWGGWCIGRLLRSVIDARKIRFPYEYEDNERSFGK